MTNKLLILVILLWASATAFAQIDASKDKTDASVSSSKGLAGLDEGLVGYWSFGLHP